MLFNKQGLANFAGQLTSIFYSTHTYQFQWTQNHLVEFWFSSCGFSDPKLDTKLTIDGKQVVVPQGKPKPTGVTSAFHQSEYLVYKESQNRIRYLLLFDFN